MKRRKRIKGNVGCDKERKGNRKENEEMRRGTSGENKERNQGNNEEVRR